MEKYHKHIVIIGGGLAGISLIRSLANHPTLGDALNMRNIILQRLESAVKLKDENRQKKNRQIN
ncbi:hypothetical protein [Chryseobacterium populi]|uniref:Pyridine nucleotide-disulfide oxidoreductase n=1 Tax=Chryseobacterium populi TaxID=1144316 RepID=J2JLF4_9FLAO|nr:hypothetical protein [Chryseobacterium populi]EJL68715.1 hypothetical protein PMI13_03541 [Chryseobacterium populi]